MTRETLPIDGISRALRVLRLIEGLACSAEDLNCVSADGLSMTLHWIVDDLTTYADELHAQAHRAPS